MKKNILLVSSTLVASILLSGCSLSNPFGIGYEKSACEMSSGFGVCGEPKKIYANRDKIKKLQNDYMNSGYKEELFFGINDTGDMLVKESREGDWQRYDTSSIKTDIEKLLKDKKALVEKANDDKRISSGISYGQDVPVTVGTDLSVKYTIQKPLIETRTNVGEIIRDNGLIQKIWIAPVVDNKNDLVSAHEIYLVVKEPKWVVGEETPKNVKRATDLPTPISDGVLKRLDTFNEHQAKVIDSFNTDNKGALLEEIQKESNEQINDNQDLNLLNNYIKEK